MFGLRKRRRLPAEATPELDRDERILAWAPVSGAAAGDAGQAGITGADRNVPPAPGSVVIATNRGLWWDGARIGWHEIAKAVWDGTALTVTLSEVIQERAGYQVIADTAPQRRGLDDPDNLPHQVRLRVTGSVAYPAHHRLPGGGGAWMAARRVPGVDGLSWVVRYDPGTDADDPAVMAETDQLIASARADAEVE